MAMVRFNPFRDLERLTEQALDSTRLSAEFDRGVLMPDIPVTEASKPRTVEIGTGAETTEKMSRIAERASGEEHASV